MTVANTILEQLGGNKFIAMTGAKNFLSDGNTLRMMEDIKKISGVYADMLQDIFTATTGMATHL